jgi:glycosyltransferase involved in cell wall biosynthesis
VLQVLHRFEARGGVEEHSRAIIESLRGEVSFNVALPHYGGGAWADFLVERPAAHLRIARLNPDLATPGIQVIGHLANPSDAGVEAAFRNLLEGAFDVVHFQSPVGWNTMRLARIARESGSRVVIGVHDLSWMCADYNMMTGPADLPCGRDAAHGADAGCGPCLKGKSIAQPTRAPTTITAYIDERYAQAVDSIAAADVIVCPSEYMAGRVKRAFGESAASRIRVIGHGVADFPLVRTAMPRPMLRVAYLGGFSRRKGAHHLMEAARRLAGQGIVIEAWGIVDTRLEAEARACGILLRGRYANADLPRMLTGIDLVVITTTLEESFCLVLSEAQRLGIPVAAARTGAIPERIADGQTGFLFEVGDVGALSALLLRLRDDRGPLDAVAARLRDERPKTIAANAAEYLALYRELAAVSRTRTAVPLIDSAGLTAAALGFPRQRSHTPLGDDGYDRWIASGPDKTPSGAAAADGFETMPLSDDPRAANRAIAQSAAAWIVVSEAGDRVEPHALATFARAAREYPRAALLYCDDDAMSSRGERYDPVLKPGFSAELLRHSPYVAGLCALRRDRLVSDGGLRAPGWEGIVERALRLGDTDPAAVIRVPSLLVHRLDLNLRASQSRETFGVKNPSPLAMEPVAVFVHGAQSAETARACVEALGLRARGRLAAAFSEHEGVTLAQVLARARSNRLVVVDARCANFRSGWLEGLERGLDGPRRAVAVPDLAAPNQDRIPGWEVIGAGRWAIAGPPPALREPGSMARLYSQPRNVSAFAARLALLDRRAAMECAAAEELSQAGSFACAHLSLCLADAGYELLAWPLVAADYAAPAPEVKPTDVGSLARPAEVDWMRARWKERLDDDPCFHPALALTGEALEPARRFSVRESRAEPPVRICAFPFDRWGSGEMRVRQPCAALERSGLAEVLVMPEHDTGRVPNLLEWRRLRPDTLFAHNFLHDYQLLALEEYARHSTALRVLGLDDLLTAIPPGNPYSATIYPDIAARIARAVALCDRLVVSTAMLAEAYAAGKDVRVIPNTLDEVRWAGLANVPRGGARPRVGWAGARQHLGDLALLEPVVRATHKEVDWVFFGMCPPSIRTMAAEFHDMVPIARYPERLASLGLDVAVAPLQDLPFNRAKSHLKLLEYGILGIPAVASDVAPYRGSPAILVSDDPRSWIDALMTLARDRDGARARGHALREYVLTKWVLSRMLGEWKRALDSRARG